MDEKQVTFPGYYLYLGKSIKNEKIEYYWREVTESGYPIGDPKLAYWSKKNFPFAKRPSVGAIYRVNWVVEDRSRYLDEADYERFVSKHPDKTLVAQLELGHKAAVVEYDVIRAKKKELNKWVLGTMTLSDIKHLIDTSKAGKRRAVIAVVLQYIQTGS